MAAAARYAKELHERNNNPTYTKSYHHYDTLKWDELEWNKVVVVYFDKSNNISTIYTGVDAENYSKKPGGGDGYKIDIQRGNAYNIVIYTVDVDKTSIFCVYDRKDVDGEIKGYLRAFNDESDQNFIKEECLQVVNRALPIVVFVLNSSQKILDVVDDANAVFRLRNESDILQNKINELKFYCGKDTGCKIDAISIKGVYENGLKHVYTQTHTYVNKTFIDDIDRFRKDVKMRRAVYKSNEPNKEEEFVGGSHKLQLLYMKYVRKW